MGEFLTNYQVKSEDFDKIAKLMERVARKRAYIAPAKNGWITVYDEFSENQDDNELHRIAQELSSKVQCAVFAFLVHDGIPFVYLLYDNGNLIDIYCSVPDELLVREAWRGHPKKLVQYALPGTNEQQIASVLQGQNMFALEVVTQFVSLFGIDAIRAYCGFKYIEEDDHIENEMLDVTSFKLVRGRAYPKQHNNVIQFLPK